ncbi:hypothetical protein H0A71_09285 [Alcaligenaceae bacterium]|nr:hypothetical protein [Alcaligenaceae bacterium]
MKISKILMAVAVSMAFLPAGAALAADAAPGAMNWFGGPVYDGAPALDITAALVKAGGGAENFSFPTALVSMLGEKTVNAEVEKLNKQFGQENTKHFVDGMTWDVHDALKRATEAGVKLPAAPADMKGPALAKALVQAGTAPDGAFWSGHLFDKLLSHQIHNQVMADVDAKFGHGSDQNTHYILNQAMYDVAQALGMKDVKLAPTHLPKGK